MKPKLKPIGNVKPDDFESAHKVAMRMKTEPGLPNGLSSMLGLSKICQSNEDNEKLNKSRVGLSQPGKSLRKNSQMKRIETEGI